MWTLIIAIAYVNSVKYITYISGRGYLCNIVLKTYLDQLLSIGDMADLIKSLS